MTTTPLDGPFPTGRQLCDYSNDPGYAIPPGSGTTVARGGDRAMSVTIVNPEAIPGDLPPGTYCCRLDESSHFGDFRARLITPPRPHVPGDCLIQLVKQADVPDPEAGRMARTERTDTEEETGQ